MIVFMCYLFTASFCMLSLVLPFGVIVNWIELFIRTVIGLSSHAQANFACFTPEYVRLSYLITPVPGITGLFM